MRLEAGRKRLTLSIILSLRSAMVFPALMSLFRHRPVPILKAALEVTDDDKRELIPLCTSLLVCLHERVLPFFLTVACNRFFAPSGC